MKTYRFALWAAIVLAILNSPLTAEVLKVPRPAPVSQSGAAVNVSMPARGMRMDDVEAKFGKPAEKLPAVGDPPITRWAYPEYTVYFEADTVLHSVLAVRR